MPEEQIPLTTQNLTLSVTHPSSQTIDGFWILWLQYVRGFDAEHHCKKCLLGKTSQHFKGKPWRVGNYRLNEFDADYLYLCGVASEWQYANNLHVPIRPKPGESFEVQTYRGAKIRVLGGELMEIPALPDGWLGLGKKFTTCRNFQWAVETYGVRRVVRVRQAGKFTGGQKPLFEEDEC